MSRDTRVFDRFAMAVSVVGLSRYGYTKASPQPPPLALVLGRPTPTGRPSNFGK